MKQPLATLQTDIIRISVSIITRFMLCQPIRYALTFLTQGAVLHVLSLSTFHASLTLFKTFAFFFCDFSSQRLPRNAIKSATSCCAFFEAIYRIDWMLLFWGPPVSFSFYLSKVFKAKLDTFHISKTLCCFLQNLILPLPFFCSAK